MAKRIQEIWLSLALPTCIFVSVDSLILGVTNGGGGAWLNVVTDERDTATQIVVRAFRMGDEVPDHMQYAGAVNDDSGVTHFIFTNVI